MLKEEAVLFPYITQLEAAAAGRAAAVFQPFGTIKNPIGMMTAEHDKIETILIKMREAIRDHSLPEGSCQSIAELYDRLDSLESDLRRHIHLENDILFPRAAELEEEVFNAAAEVLNETTE